MEKISSVTQKKVFVLKNEGEIYINSKVLEFKPSSETPLFSSIRTNFMPSSRRSKNECIDDILQLADLAEVDQKFDEKYLFRLNDDQKETLAIVGSFTGVYGFPRQKNPIDSVLKFLYNQLKSPEFIKDLGDKLKKIYFSRVESSYMFKVISHLPKKNLQHVDLAHNDIKSIEGLEVDGLKTLDLSGNKIVSLKPFSKYQFNFLEELNLMDHRGPDQFRFITRTGLSLQLEIKTAALRESEYHLGSNSFAKRILKKEYNQDETTPVDFISLIAKNVDNRLIIKHFEMGLSILGNDSMSTTIYTIIK